MWLISILDPILIKAKPFQFGIVFTIILVLIQMVYYLIIELDKAQPRLGFRIFYFSQGLFHLFM